MYIYLSSKDMDNFSLGYKYQFENNNLEKAIKHYLLSVNEGNYRAQYILGVMYEKGNNLIEKDMKEAFKLYKLSADQGFSFGQYGLGNLYYFSNDIENAIYYLTLSANKGICPAQLNLGIIFEQQNNYEKAFYYYKLCNSEINIQRLQSNSKINISLNVYNCDECIICLNTFTFEHIYLKCGHKFHLTCSKMFKMSYV